MREPESLSTPVKPNGLNAAAAAVCYQTGFTARIKRIIVLRVAAT